MVNAEFEKLKEALRKAPTEAARKEAAEAFERYRVVSLAKGGSKPTLVTLGRGRGYPNAVPLDKIPQELERNPEFFKLLKRVVAKEKS